jgi:hypothetical protein
LKNLQRNFEGNIPMYIREETSWETTSFFSKVLDYLTLVNYNDVAKIIFLASKFLKSANIWFRNNYASFDDVLFEAIIEKFQIRFIYPEMQQISL